MANIIITLQNRASGEIFAVQMPMRGGHPVWVYHIRALAAHSGCYVKKSIVKR